MIQEIIVMLVVLSGLIVGKFIAKYTKEEIKLGKKSLLFSKSLLLASISITTFYYAGYLEALYLFLGIFLGYLFKFTDIYLGMAVLASALFLKPFFIVIATLAFIYYLVRASLELPKLSSVTFLLPLVLLFVPVLPSGHLASLAAGLLVSSM